MKTPALLALATCLVVVPAAADEASKDISCVDQLPEKSTVQDYVRCLEDKISANQQMIGLNRERAEKRDDELKHYVLTEFQQVAPKKNVMPIRGGIYWCFGTWGNATKPDNGGGKPKQWWAKDPKITPEEWREKDGELKTPDGFIKVGAIDIKPESVTLKFPASWHFDNHEVRTHCSVPSGWCDGPGERCFYKKRTAGCFVNKDYYEWHTKENPGREISEAEICHGP